MKESNWDDCLINKSAKTITPDLNRLELLAGNAKERIYSKNRSNHSKNRSIYK